ncbi:hypothetical protein Tco_0800664 [Tanacetum coccineum]|uniref:Uncharacterized protein n=1 Tax=Tanacetum coccineum TaxID=301880 RepID=A0ABQ4ZWN8_9ASTR
MDARELLDHLQKVFKRLRWTLNEEDNVIDIGLEVLIGIQNYLYLYDVRPSENDLIEHTCKAILATFSMIVWTWRHFYWIYWKTRVVVILPQRMLLWTMWVTPLLGTIYGPSDQHALMKTLCIHRASFGSEQNTTLNTQCARSLGSSSLCQTDFRRPQNVVRFLERETTSLEIPVTFIFFEYWLIYVSRYVFDYFASGHSATTNTGVIGGDLQLAFNLLQLNLFRITPHFFLLMTSINQSSLRKEVLNLKHYNAMAGGMKKGMDSKLKWIWHSLPLFCGRTKACQDERCGQQKEWKKKERKGVE